jgi:hypothetical protein
MLRCIVCGCSRWDPKGYKCALCSGSHGPRSEKCHITEDTKSKLVAHAEELKTFGVTLEKQSILEKSADGLAIFGVALALADSLNAGVLRKLVLYLRDLAIPKEEILRLRLDEPEQVLEVLSVEEPNDPPNDKGRAAPPGLNRRQ